MSDVRRLVIDDRTNAALVWAGVAALLALCALAVVRGRAFRALLAAALAAVVAVPAVARRDPTVAPPWELLAVAVAPVAARAVGYGGAVTVSLTVATIALLIAVELHAFTSVAMTARFAAAFVVVTTMATAGAAGIAAYVIEVATGAALIAGRIAFMWDLVGATAVGTVAAAGFARYVREAGSSAGGDLA